MNLPRFLFVAGMGRATQAHPSWPDVHQTFCGEVDEDGSWVAWRLTAANHRELGRSPRVFPDLARASEDATMLRGQIDEVAISIVTVSNTMPWGWRLRLHDVTVATSSRGYARHRECAYNVSVFTAAARIAEIGELRSASLHG